MSTESATEGNPHSVQRTGYTNKQNKKQNKSTFSKIKDPQGKKDVF